MVVLGLHGKAGAGKDTCADYIIEEHGWTQKIAFGQNLKDMCSHVFDIPVEAFHDQRLKHTKAKEPWVLDMRELQSILAWVSDTHPTQGIDLEFVLGTKLFTPRHILQFVGTEVCRYIAEDYHVDVVQHKINSIENLLDYPGKYIITDVRFPNEAGFITNRLGGMIVKIVRNKLESQFDRTHPSETSMGEWKDFYKVLYNREGLFCFHHEIDRQLKEIL